MNTKNITTQVKEYIGCKIFFLKGTIENYMSWAEKDFAVFFTGKAISCYKANYELREYERWLQLLKSGGTQTLVDHLRFLVSGITEYMLRGRLMPNSSDAMCNVAFLAELESRQAVLNVATELLAKINEAGESCETEH